MNKVVINTLKYLYLPLLFPYFLTSKRDIIRSDAKRWLEIWGYNEAVFTFSKLLLLLTNRIFRSVFYYRIKTGNILPDYICRLFSLVYIPERTLLIYTRDIGPGLFVQHGLSTIIAAKKIGVNFWVNQQVTIGYTNDNDCPTIGDNVTVNAGSIIVGKLKIGDNVKVGASSVVIGSIPDNSVVFSEPSRYFPRL